MIYALLISCAAFALAAVMAAHYSWLAGHYRRDNKWYREELVDLSDQYQKLISTLPHYKEPHEETRTTEESEARSKSRIS